jgi:hypothetical protein
MKKICGLTVPALWLLWIGGCGAEANVSPLGVDQLPQQAPEIGLIWRNGAFGNFCSSRPTYLAGAAKFYKVVNIVDNINGDSKTLLVDGGAAGPAPYLDITISPAVDASTFFPNGHLQFDLASDSNGGPVHLMQVQCDHYWNSVVFVPPTVGSRSFVHYSLPLSSLGINSTQAVSSIFINCSPFGWGNGNYLVNDLKWTMD